MNSTISTNPNNEQPESIAPIAASRLLRICKAASVSAPATPCTVGEMNSLLNSRQVYDICQQLRALPDDEAHAQERARLKKSLPVLCFNAREFAAGKRCNAGAKPSGLCLMDIDHAGDVDAMVEGWGPKELLPAYGVYMLQRSVSGHGIHLVIGVRPGEDIAQAQERVAGILGIEDWDRACRELARASFISPATDVMFFHPEAFFADADATDIIKVESNEAIDEAEVIGNPEAEQMCYRGVAYRYIIEGIEKYVMGLSAEPTAESHNRHNTYMEMLGYMRYFCDNDPQLMLSVMPAWGLPEDERKKMCLTTAGYTYKAMPRRLQRLFDQLVEDQKHGTQDKTNRHRPLPARLPRFFRLLTKIFPVQYHKQVVAGSMPLLGTLATALRYRKNPYTEMPATFMTVVRGPLASGKGFSRVLFEKLLRPVIEQDERAMQELQRWKDEKEAAGNGKGPKRPHLIMRQVYPDFTTAALNQQLKDAKEQHLIFFSEEIDDFVMDRKFSAKLREAYDGVRTGQTRVSAQSVSGGARSNINMFACGTPAAVRKALPNPEDGLVSRMNFVAMPNLKSFEKLKWGELTQRENDELERRIQALYDIGRIEPVVADEQSEDEMPAEFRQDTYDKVYVKLPRTEQRIDEWIEQIQAEIDADPEKEALGRFARRIPDLMRRVSMVLYACEGMRESNESLDLMLWIADESLQNLLDLYGHQYEELCNAEELASKAYIRNHKAVDLYESVPTRFTLSDLMTKRRELGMPDSTESAKTTICRWKKRGLVRVDGANDQGDRLYAKVLRLEVAA